MLLSAACWLITGCKPGEIDLRLKPQNNSHYRMVFTTKGNVSMNMAGKDIGTDINTSIASLLKIDTLPGSKYLFELTYDDYDVKQNINGKKIDLKDIGNDSTGDFQKGMSLIKGISYKLVVASTGKAEELKSNDSLINRIDRAMADMPEQGRKQLMAAITPLVNSDMAKGMLEQCFYVFPHKKVNIGDSWDNEIVMQTVFSMVINSTYTLMEIKDSIAQIKVHADITPGKSDVVLMPGLAMTSPKGSDPAHKEPGLDLMGMKMKASFSGTQDGLIWVNMKSGMVQKKCLEPGSYR